MKIMKMVMAGGTMASALAMTVACGTTVSGPSATSIASEAAVQGSVEAQRLAPTPGPTATPVPLPVPSTAPNGQQNEDVGAKGVIDGIAGANLKVGGREVHTDGETVVRRGGVTITLADLRVGQAVEVEGFAVAGGALRARLIEVEAGLGKQVQEEVLFTGRIDGITAPNLKVGGRAVVTDAGTRIEAHGTAISLGTLEVGDLVEVEGVAQKNGSVRATGIHLQD